MRESNTIILFMYTRSLAISLELSIVIVRIISL